MNRDAAAVLGFWLEEIKPEQRFRRDAAVDAVIRERFGALHARLAADVSPEWREHPRDILAAIVVLDQFSRNLFRDDPRAFAQDPAALVLAKEAVDKGWDRDLSATERQFLYLPFEHAESLTEADRSVALFDALGEAQGVEYARRHHAVIARFGRYPARNNALGRESTAEERAFLADHPEGF